MREHPKSSIYQTKVETHLVAGVMTYGKVKTIEINIEKWAIRSQVLNTGSSTTTTSAWMQFRD